MSCIFQDLMDGKCTLFCDEIERPGCNDDGICICADDEDPSFLCEDYDSGDDFDDVLPDDDECETDCEGNCEDCPWGNTENTDCSGEN